MGDGIDEYAKGLAPHEAATCNALRAAISSGLPEATAKIWHGHPVWFLKENPIVGYSKQKSGIRLMFWSGAGFDESCLDVVGKKFKDASVFLTSPAELNSLPLERLFAKAREIQWDYANVAKRKGTLERLS